MAAPFTYVRAAALVPGDLLVDAKGERVCAAFDVHVHPDVPIVTVWPAFRDVESGSPERFDLHAGIWVLIRPRPTTETEAAAAAEAAAEDAELGDLPVDWS